jgi:hypothetical protein
MSKRFAERHEMKLADVQRLLKRQCEQAGGLSAFAAAHGLTRQYISYVLKGQRSPGRKLQDALGIRSDGERWTKK